MTLTGLAVDAPIWALILVVCWLTRKAARVLDTRCARDYLEVVRECVADAVLSTSVECRDRMMAASDVPTNQEHRSVQKAALHRVLDEVSIDTLARALRQVRGTRVSAEDARNYIVERVDRELERRNLRPRVPCSDETDDTVPSGSRPG